MHFRSRAVSIQEVRPISAERGDHVGILHTVNGRIEDGHGQRLEWVHVIRVENHIATSPRHDGDVIVL